MRKRLGVQSGLRGLESRWWLFRGSKCLIQDPSVLYSPRSNGTAQPAQHNLPHKDKQPLLVPSASSQKTADMWGYIGRSRICSININLSCEIYYPWKVLKTSGPHLTPPTPFSFNRSINPTQQQRALLKPSHAMLPCSKSRLDRRKRCKTLTLPPPYLTAGDSLSQNEQN